MMITSPGYKVFRFAALTLIVLVLVLPIVWMVLAALKTNVDIYDASKTLIFTPTFENFDKVFAQGNFGQYIINSGVIAIAVTLLAFLQTALFLYGEGRHRHIQLAVHHGLLDGQAAKFRNF